MSLKCRVINVTFSRWPLKLSTPDEGYLRVIFRGPRLDCLTELLTETVYCYTCSSYHEGQVASLTLAAERNAHVHVLLVTKVAEISGFYSTS